MFFFTENNQNSKANQSNSKSDINLTIKKIIYQQLLITLYKIIKMTRKEFFQKAGAGAALMLVPACIAGLATSCSKDSAATTSTNNPSGSNLPANIDFTIDVSTGNLAINGGSLVQNRVIVAK